jgi:hypothetical protein
MSDVKRSPTPGPADESKVVTTQVHNNGRNQAAAWYIRNHFDIKVNII